MQALTLTLEEKQQLRRYQRHTEKTELCGSRARAEEMAVVVPLLSSLFFCNLNVSTMLTMLSSPHTWPNLNLLWPGELHLLHPGDSLKPTPPNSHCWRNSMAGQPAPPGALFWRLLQKQSTELGPGTSRVTCGGRQQFLTRATSFFEKITRVYGPKVGSSWPQCDLRHFEWPQAHHWHQS